MTTTQAVCESMGWKLIKDPVPPESNYWVDHNGDFLCEEHDLEFSNDAFGNWLSKKLQARLVKEWWEIKIYNAIGVCQALARQPGDDDYKMQSNPMGENEEPSALLSLYCKIHGIEVGNEKQF
jgi:hypothetical protein